MAHMLSDGEFNYTYNAANQTVMSVYSSTRTFLSDLGTAVGSGEMIEAGDAIKGKKAEEAPDKVQE